MTTPPLQEAVDREAAWLTATGDGLPALLKKFGGPWDDVQAYYARTPRTQQRSIYVTRRELTDGRTSNTRVMIQHQFSLRLVWPVLTGTGNAEGEQRALDAAVKLLIHRIRGPVGDKTHGGRFLSVAENPRWVHVAFDPAEATLGAKELTGTVTYSADDLEVNG